MLQQQQNMSESRKEFDTEVKDLKRTIGTSALRLRIHLGGCGHDRWRRCRGALAGGTIMVRLSSQVSEPLWVLGWVRWSARPASVGG